MPLKKQFPHHHQSILYDYDHDNHDYDDHDDYQLWCSWWSLWSCWLWCNHKERLTLQTRLRPETTVRKTNQNQIRMKIWVEVSFMIILFFNIIYEQNLFIEDVQGENTKTVVFLNGAGRTIFAETALGDLNVGFLDKHSLSLSLGNLWWPNVYLR